MYTHSHPLETEKANRFFLWMPVLALAAALILSPSLSRGEEAFIPIDRYTSEPAELYQQPSFDARISIELEKEARLTLIDQQGEWYVVRLPNDRVGWIHGRYLAGMFPPAEESRYQLPPEEPAEADRYQRPSEPAAESPQPSPDDRQQEETAKAATPAPAEPPQGLYTVVVKVDSGRIRTRPNLEAPVLLGVSRGETAAVLETEGQWRRIRLPDGRTGWGHRILFRKIDAADQAPEPPPETGNDAQETASGGEMTPDLSPDEKKLYTVRSILDDAGEEQLIFQLSGFHPPETFVIEDDAPPRVVCDFRGVGPGKALRRQIPVNGGMIRRVRIGVHPDPEKKVRAVVDLVPDQTYSVEQVFIKGKGQYILTFKATDKRD